MSSEPKKSEGQTAAGDQPRPLSPENQRLLAFLDEFMKTPDEMGEAWWDEFRDFLRKNPIKLGKPGMD